MVRVLCRDNMLQHGMADFTALKLSIFSTSANRFYIQTLEVSVLSFSASLPPRFPSIAHNLMTEKIVTTV